MRQVLQILGVKRILILAVLIGINAAVGAATYLYFMPHNDDLTRQLQTLTSQVTAKRADTNRLQNEFQEIQQQKVYFGNLQAGGFFSNQNRAVARQRINDIQQFTNILSAKYDITAATVEKSPPADDAGYVILDSPMHIDVEAIDDIDVYNFLFWVENAFPGQVSTKSIDISRVTDVNEATLRELGSGIPVTLIKASVGFDWRTMVPASQVVLLTPPKG